MHYQSYDIYLLTAVGLSPGGIKGNNLRRKPMNLTKLHILKSFSLTVECLGQCRIRRSRGYEGQMRQTAKKVATVNVAVRAQDLRVSLIKAKVLLSIP
jgi:hypothetical protein